MPRAKRREPCSLCTGASERDGLRADPVGDLDGCKPDTARGGRYQHEIPHTGMPGLDDAEGGEVLIQIPGGLEGESFAGEGMQLRAGTIARSA